MIEKKRPRKLNSTRDSRVRGADEMYDAYNINVSTDHDASSEGGAGGDGGVIKPADGNGPLRNFEGIPKNVTIRVLSSLIDDQHDVIYYFVWSNEAQYHGVYAYDPKNFFPNQNNEDKVKLVYRTKLFKFESDKHIKADIVVLSKEITVFDKDYDVDPVLYFTDGKNEPRKIHVLDAYRRMRSTNGTEYDFDDSPINPSSITNGLLNRYEWFDTNDYIHACPKTPVQPPKAYFENDPQSRVSNFEGISGLQFAYQYVYDTGEESAISTYSDLIVPNGYLQQGARPSANLSLDNICVIRIPLYKKWLDDEAQATANSSANPKGSDFAVRYVPKNVKEIRIIGREGNNGSFFVIDTVSNPLFSGTYPHEHLEYQFRNDRIKRGFSKKESQKPFDSVPLKAGTQVAASNRMMYGDYVTGYDNVDVSATATINYKERGEDFKTIDIDVFSTLDFLNKETGPGVVNDRRASIVFSVEDFPPDNDGLPKDTQVDIILTVRPKRNWHIYNAKNSFHGSRHLANPSGAVIDQSPATADLEIQPWRTGPNLAADGLSEVGNVPGTPGELNSSRSRLGYLSNRGLNNMWGRNKGVCVGDLNQGDGTANSLPKWKTVDSQANLGTDTVTGVFGTSAANPFIIRGRPLLFQLSFRVKVDGFRGIDYKAKLKDYIETSLGGPLDEDGNIIYDGVFYPDGESPFFETLYVSRSFEYVVNEGLDGGSAETTQEEASSGNKNKIDVLSDEDDRKHLIISVGNYDLINSTDASSQQNIPPCGYIIVNKARPKFSLRARRNLADGSNYGVLQLNLDRIGRFSSPDDVEILTAIPYIPSDFWLSKGLYTNAGNRDEQNGVDNTKAWFSSSFSNLTNDKNWGLFDVSAWQFETRVIDSWWCFSKEYMVRNTLPPFLFTSVETDYALYVNGSDVNIPTEGDLPDTWWGELADDVVSFVGIDSLDAVTSSQEAGQILSSSAYGTINSGRCTNNGRLKNAAVVKNSRMKEICVSSVLSELVGDFVEALTDQSSVGGGLHFRHNANGYIGGDGILVPMVANSYDAFNGMDTNENLTRARIVGWLDTGEGWLADRANKIYAGNPLTADNVPDWESGFTTIDGAGGIGASPGGGEARLTYDDGLSCAMGSVNAMMVYGGYIGPRATVMPSRMKRGDKPGLGETTSVAGGELMFDTFASRYDSYFDNYGQDCMMPFLGQFNYLELNILDRNFGYRWTNTFLSAIHNESTKNWPGNNVEALYYATPLDITDVDQGGQTRLDSALASNQNHDWRQDYSLTQSRKEMLLEILDVGGGTLLGSDLKSGWRSFKTRANHDFGIVFYDERGRAGRVNPIVFSNDDAGVSLGDDIPILPTYSSSVYVAGFSERESANMGSVSIEIELDEENTPPPPWASSYQIVYGGNSTKSRFIQYVTGGAFIAIGDEESAEEENTNIYVSLNYLQGNKDVSYAESFGAMNPLGSKQLYTYSPGDKLRVISYFTEFDDDNPTAGREFPSDFEFEIVGMEVLSSNPEDNPIHRSFPDDNNQSKMSDAKSGHFLVLKNNPFAAGFSFNDVKNGQNAESTSSHYWNNICVVEIYSPTKESVEQDEKLYYEISNVYDVGKNSEGNKYYKTNPILLERGDVWWRQVPLAVPKFEDGKFQNLIKYNVEEEESSQPRFQPYWLESQTFNDTFAGNNGLGRGKPNIIDDEFGQRRNKSGIVYSEPHQFEKSKNRFSSFNAIEGNYKILPGEYGKIEYLMNNFDSILMFQENKVSSIPVERSILSTADGSNSLVQSKEVIGLQSFYAGDYGTGGNPESVLSEGSYVFFASKQNSEVYRLTIGGSIEVISSLGLKNDFYNVFNSVNTAVNNSSSKTVWIPTGYDRINDEFLITIDSILKLDYSFSYTYDGQYMGETVGDEGYDIDINDPSVVPGCSLSNAVNYDIFATGEDNDSCVYFGCTDNTAVNYDPSATLECDNTNSTVVPFNTSDGTVYQTVSNFGIDCVCRYFNPCIIDSFAVSPNGKVDFQDVVDVNALFNEQGGEAEIQPGFTDLNFGVGFQLFEEDVLRLIGLDLYWVTNLPAEQIPPTSLAPYGGGAWPIVQDQWDDYTFYLAIARYTEGPPPYVPDPTVNPNEGIPVLDQISQAWAESGVVEWWNGYTPEIIGFGGEVFPAEQVSDNGYWCNPDVLQSYVTQCTQKANDSYIDADGVQQPNLDTHPTDVDPPAPFWESYEWSLHNPVSNGCAFTGCQDSTAINNNPAATADCREESGPPLGSRLAIVECGQWNSAADVPSELGGIPSSLEYRDSFGLSGAPAIVDPQSNDGIQCCELFDNFGSTFNPGPGWVWNDAVTSDCVTYTGNQVGIGYCFDVGQWAQCPYFSTLSIGTSGGPIVLPTTPVPFWEIWDNLTGAGGIVSSIMAQGVWSGPDFTFAQWTAQYGVTGGQNSGPRLTSDGYFVNVKNIDQLNSIINWLNNSYVGNQYVTVPEDTEYFVLPNGDGYACLQGGCDNIDTGGGIADIRSGGYVYWDACCQYECQGQYAVVTNQFGDLAFDLEADFSVFTGDFINPQNAGETNRPPGIPECYQLLYSIDDYPAGTPNPEEQ